MLPSPGIWWLLRMTRKKTGWYETAQTPLWKQITEDLFRQWFTDGLFDNSLTASYSLSSLPSQEPPQFSTPRSRDPRVHSQTWIKAHLLPVPPAEAGISECSPSSERRGSGFLGTCFFYLGVCFTSGVRAGWQEKQTKSESFSGEWLQ